MPRTVPNTVFVIGFALVCQPHIMTKALFVKDNRSVRPSLFIDAGNVFDSNCPDFSTYCDTLDLSQLRYSAGISLTWITGMGPLSFAISKAFNTVYSDEEETFQFELGRTF